MKYEYHCEYEIKASPKMLFPYFSTPNGLSEWFAQKVNVLPDKSFDIYWDNSAHPAKIVAQKTNSMIRYQFLPKSPQDSSDPAFLEFKLSYNDFTESTFVNITDYSEMTDVELLRELWDGLIDKLQEITGG